MPQQTRESPASQPTTTREKPRAKLRDSFILPQEQPEQPSAPSEHLVEETRVLSQRQQSLKALIQKHERISKSETEDRIHQKQRDEPQQPGDGGRRPGILKKPRDDQQLVTESTSRSTTTVITERGAVDSDGTVSLTRDVIKGESVCLPGEEPISKVIKSHYHYKTPENKEPLTIQDYSDREEDIDQEPSSPEARRKPSLGKSSSPERDYTADGSVRLSNITTSSITSSSNRRSRVTEEDTKKTDTIRTESARDVNRRPKVRDDLSYRKPQTTSVKVTEPDDRANERTQKYVSSTTVTSKTFKTEDDEKVSRTQRQSLGRSSPLRASPERNVPDYEDDRHQPSSDGQYYKSTVTSVTRRSSGGSPVLTVTRRSSGGSPVLKEKTPASVRRQIFSKDDEDEQEISRRTQYEKTSQESSETTTYITSGGRTTFTTSIRSSVDDRDSPSHPRSIDYDDGDESDGYKRSSYYVSSTVAERGSLRSSPDRTSHYEEEEFSEGSQSQKAERKYSKSSIQQSSESVRKSSTAQSGTTSTSRRRSATPQDEKEASPSPSSGGFSRVTRGGSVRALSQKFQQAAAEANSSDNSRSQRCYPKAGLIFRSASFRLNNGSSPVTTPTSDPGSPGLKQSSTVEVRVSSSAGSNQNTTKVDRDSKSFLDNKTRVTDVHDVLNRMRNSDQGVEEGDTEEDIEARSLLNKFLGAQVILQGMEPIMKESHTQSAALVSQVERQRALTSQKTVSSSFSKDFEGDIETVWDEALLRHLLESCTDYEGRRQIRARLRTVMAEQKACANVVAETMGDDNKSSSIMSSEEIIEDEDGARVHRRVQQGQTESTVKSSSVEDNVVTHTEVTTKSSSFSATSVGKSQLSKAPSGKPMSPFAKFQQMDRQNSQSAPSSPKTPGGTAAPIFKFTDPKLCRSASAVKDRLLFWCQSKTKEYKNIQIENFSTSWSNGLAFCALIHHFLPEAFDYDKLRPEERRKNFELAFRVADEKADIAPLLDVEDMVMMRKPDWKCVFTYVQSIYRRFKDED